MTNQQAIEVLQDMLLDYTYASHRAEVIDAVVMAVGALSLMKGDKDEPDKQTD